MTLLSSLAPAALADEAVRAVLQTQWDGVPAVRLDSPPGAGKTGIVERLAVQSLALLGERCMVATMTNEQAFDLARRLATGFPRLTFTLFVRRGLALPADLLRLGNLSVARGSAEVPAHRPCVAIANAAQWSWSDAEKFDPFDLQIVDEAFQLPDYRFQQIANLGRRLVCERPGVSAIDQPIDLVAGGASLVQVELPAEITGEVDEALADSLVRLIRRLVQRRTRLHDGAMVERLHPRHVGVVCAHVAQVNAVRERLPRGYQDVFVETADRFQGLERPVMLVYHPLSGRVDADQFHLDAGRLCVALSRHRVACFLVGRAGVEDLLLRYAPSGERVLGSDEDREYAGWRAQVEIAQRLRSAGRVLRLAGPVT